MTINDTLGTLLLTIAGITVNQPKGARTAAVKTLPTVEFFRVSSVAEHRVDGTVICNHDRFQVNMAAATYAGLEALRASVRAKLDMNHTNFILSYPLGVNLEGNDDNPKTFWCSADWLILY